MIGISYLKRTSDRCPAQWHGKTDDGKEVYIRYRWGLLRFDVDGETKADKVVDETCWGGMMDYEEMVEHLLPLLQYEFPNEETVGSKEEELG